MVSGLILNTIAMSVLTLIMCISATVGITRQLQMLQLNSYFAVRYFRWLRENKKGIWGNVILCLLSLLAGAFLRLREELFTVLFTITKPDFL